MVVATLVQLSLIPALHFLSLVSHPVAASLTEVEQWWPLQFPQSLLLGLVVNHWAEVAAMPTSVGASTSFVLFPTRPRSSYDRFDKGQSQYDHQ
jgi:hypothetical protein